MGGNCNREAGKPVLSKYQQLGKSAMLDGSSMGGECTKSWHLFPWQVEKTSPSPAQLTEGQIVRQGPVRVGRPGTMIYRVLILLEIWLIFLFCKYYGEK